MFIAMNRFKIKPGMEEQFETVWRERDTHLAGLPGFQAFHLLKGASHDDHVLYSTHTVWESKDAFEAWTKSEAFRLAHRNAGDHGDLYADKPNFEGFEAVLETLASETSQVA